MNEKINILIVEDEGIVAMGLEEMLQEEGYEVVGITDNGEEALEMVRTIPMDLILMDIHIKGKWDGIETITQIANIKSIPFIYLSAFGDAVTIDRAKQTFPSAYLTKPYQPSNLRIAIEMALNNFAFRRDTSAKVIDINKDKDKAVEGRETILHINNAIFVKQNYKFIKINLDDIYYLEADSNYTYIYTKDKKYILRHSLQSIIDKLTLNNFVRVHRSYAVNINQLTTFNDSFINLDNYQVPLGRNYKEAFFRQFNFL